MGCTMPLVRGLMAIATVCICLHGVTVLGADVDLSKLPPPASRQVDFQRDIQPILTTHCLKCHGPDKKKGGFRVDVKDVFLKGGDAHAPNVYPSKSAESPLIHFVAGLDEDMLMPQKGEPLSAEQVGLLRAWIDQGATWPDHGKGAAATESHWSFKPVVRPEVPKVEETTNAVDAFIRARLAKEKLAPSPQADRRTLIRRLSFDLVGLAPTPEDVDAFAADDSPDAYERLVNRLLASPRYGERWARHWLDVVRFAETTGFEVNTPRENAWPYRDYVIKSLNDDKPYDQFVREQLAGDQFGEDAATGFIVGGSNDMVKSPDVVLTSQQRSDELHDMVATTGSAFLGLTVGCARCHNHKFDPIPQTDYFAMTAVFAGVQHGERRLKTSDYEQRLKQADELRQLVTAIEGKLTQYEPLANPGASEPAFRAPVHPRMNAERFPPVTAKRLRLTINETSGLEPCIDELEVYTSDGSNVALASAGTRATASSEYPNAAIHKIAHVNDGKVGNNFSWISSETSKGWVELAFADAVVVDKVVWGRDREEKFKDRLATNYRIEVADEEGRFTVVASSGDRGRYIPGAPYPPLDASNDPALRELLAARARHEGTIAELTAEPTVYAGTFTNPEPTHRLHRGDPMQKREVIEPGALGAVPISFEPPSRSRRSSLAKWITDARNPLTARVMVNRIWQYHFGTGLVETPSDFGANGAKPSHSELLDFLAGEFVASKWSIKAMHRLIVNSATYRQASAARSDAMAVDDSSRLLWRYPPRRLEAEPIRDTILTVSGKLDLRMGGPGFSVFEPNDNYVRVYNAKKTFGPPEWRRMIYMTKVRMQQDATFGAFDCPDGGQIAPKRTNSTTPLQALNLLNSDFILQQAEFFAQRVKREQGDDVGKQVRRAFALAFNREASHEELSVATSFVRREGLTMFCRALLNANEFVYVY
ncbi:MAG: PSD1 and planctomycete cytochrome C domain-containing protein [Planctomycetota bacterium]|nr:PSD1 and planctomycete cytochrome C domain-containing protein [Planctomycetota bacterium]